jgi:membrane protein
MARRSHPADSEEQRRVDTIPTTGTPARRARFFTRGAQTARRLAVDIAGVGCEAGSRWAGDACYRLGASLAYAALFSVFPLLLLAVTAVGFLLGNDDAVRQRLLRSVARATSPAFQTLLDETLQSMQSHRNARGVGAVVGFVTLLLGASGVFTELQSSLNLIWRVKPPPSSGLWSTLLETLRAKASAFLVVVVAAGTLLGSVVASTGLAALGGAAREVTAARDLWPMVEETASLALLTGLIAAVFRWVPQTQSGWRDVLPGAFLTAVLFTALKSLLAWYLAHLAGYAAYGAVGAVLGLMTWIYIASLILFYGAEFTRVHTERYGSLAVGKGSPPDAAK